ncbi:MAG: (Fe-S)-binding protein [Erysipelotrichaceae bacterium]
MFEAIILMLGLGLILGALLGIANKIFYVEVDQRVEETTALLPGYNCGGCGFAGCSGLAEALVNGTVSTISLCKPSKPDQKQAIRDYLNNSVGPNGEKVEIK